MTIQCPGTENNVFDMPA